MKIDEVKDKINYVNQHLSIDNLLEKVTFFDIDKCEFDECIENFSILMKKYKHLYFKYAGLYFVLIGYSDSKTLIFQCVSKNKKFDYENKILKNKIKHIFLNLEPWMNLDSCDNIYKSKIINHIVNYFDNCFSGYYYMDVSEYLNYCQNNYIFK